MAHFGYPSHACLAAICVYTYFIDSGARNVFLQFNVVTNVHCCDLQDVRIHSCKMAMAGSQNSHDPQFQNGNGDSRNLGLF